MYAPNEAINIPRIKPLFLLNNFLNVQKICTNIFHILNDLHYFGSYRPFPLKMGLKFTAIPRFGFSPWPYAPERFVGTTLGRINQRNFRETTMNVLVIDDNAANLLFAAEVLREEGWNVHEANGGLEAMVLLETEPVDLILSDIRMPHLSGDQLMTWIQTEERFNDVRVIACTAHAQADDVRRMQEAGFDMVLVKPVDADDLLAAAKTCMQRPPRNRTAAN